jgi:hypothetical protein
MHAPNRQWALGIDHGLAESVPRSSPSRGLPLGFDASNRIDANRLPDASALFNLMRNLGGAIGLAAIDTAIYTGSPAHGCAIVDRFQAGDMATAKSVGITLDLFAARPTGPLDDHTWAMSQPLVERAALDEAIDEASTLIALLTVAALVCVPFAEGSPQFAMRVVPKVLWEIRFRAIKTLALSATRRIQHELRLRELV